jgi:hypothetical protein
MKKSLCCLVILLFIFSIIPQATMAQSMQQDIFDQRMALYLKYETLLHVPWYYLAAMDQYERNIQAVRKDIPSREGLISFYIEPNEWVGILNPFKEDNMVESIRFFGGIGKDGNGDGLADRNNDEDLLFTLAKRLSQYGYTWDDYKIALWDYYQNDIVTEQVLTIARLYHKFQTLDLTKRSFPLPLHANYSYRSTFGAGRGWGGRRIHEGTDLFAHYGVPVRSTTYGKIEIMGWNDYGGWRVGIRDINNVYHYYAHLSGFDKEVKEGDLVKPGTVLGYVGSSGYGKPGTSGKFPPHLHYGMYKFNGKTEWSFDPYPSLRAWEKLERARKRNT